VDSIPVLEEKSFLSPPVARRRSLIDTVNDAKIQYAQLVGFDVPYVHDVSVGLWISYVIISDGTIWGMNTIGGSFSGFCDDWTEEDDTGTPILVNTTDFYYRDEDPFAQQFYYPYSMNGLAPDRTQLAVVDDNYWHAFFLDTTGTAWMLGAADDGIAGAGEDVDTEWQCLFPAGVNSHLERLYVDIDVFGQGGAVAIDSTGLLWTWGYEAYGYIGNGESSFTGNPYDSQKVAFNPTQGGLNGEIDITGKTWISVGAAWKHAAAIDTEGRLWTWGVNNVGAMGRGSSAWYCDEYPTQVGSDTDWLSVQGGEYGVVAQKTDGSLWGWGDLFASTYQYNVPTSLNLSCDLGDWEYAYYWIMANVNGSTKVMGYNTADNQLGLGDLPKGTTYTDWQDFPVDFVKFDIESWHGIGFDTDKNVYIWGEDYTSSPVIINQDWLTY
jgi:alpha-tubulin suppressor-like RCC1 family protein